MRKEVPVGNLECLNLQLNAFCHIFCFVFFFLRDTLPVNLTFLINFVNFVNFVVTFRFVILFFR